MTTNFVAIDLSQLPPPHAVEQLDYEQILAERKAYAISLWPEDQQAEITARLALESEPLTKLLEENAYREMLWRQRVNEAALANMLASAQGADLDQLAANYNVKRLVIQPGDPSKVPPVPEQLESDDSLRERAQMAWEGLSTAGPRNSYIFHARAADGRVGDASAVSPSPAVAVITVQSAIGNGTAPAELLAVVERYLSDEDRRPVADRLIVQSAEVIEYSISASLFLTTIGPEAEPIQAAARAQLEAYVFQRRRLGMEVSESAIHAALHVEGVRKVELAGWADIAATASQAPYCTNITLTIGTEP
ncbi:baseplate assembly protein [Pseudomonas aeruginosa]|uniref:baseplate assembly protein n=2 Tax=Pseudomonas aeruginosa TaxID=287 RepID=UPI000B40DB89|nr:baseplate assembly protein [Pseudomonas aeruginosa]DBA08197.1 TPA_asm: Phage baseplate assembly protein GpJ [Pseudomonas phage vB_PaeM-D14A]AVK20730.1 baseplate J-like family protein [Pseudomonas aeruginosa]EIU3601351.1 baseplate assembly protein [Pseudomonas aeruginosa]EIU3802283.1 baseplate assembly protein [Pseudomonas aeruginosa]EKU8356125.1 baseplate assembly protein [Pseudomonas aeruginosa]